ncbi:integrin beta-1-like isoform X2 [Apostichopus japonicus]|uniref:integrin beta-1-like isoform X2 n=1 Tax=Stichopus japonicus TaxID=307972 RepID=UPI003AB9002D
MDCKHSIFLLLLLYCARSIYAQNLGEVVVFEIMQAASPCNDAKTCGACIVLDPSCGWCTQGNFTDTGSPRCDTIPNLRMQGCSEYTSPNSSYTIDLDKELSNAGNTTNLGEAVQVKPQEITLKLRPGQPTQFTFQVRQAEDYPVDLYYVMDLSKSMEDDLVNLRKVGDILAEEMSQITSDFRMGFGSFVDKVVMPYVSTVPAKLAEPCSGCQAPYGFKNELSLTGDTSEFSRTINQLQVSGNLDAPEGGMDALMQVTVCKEAIGWRDMARHLVIFTTDASFHYAGDGKLGGIVKPNDGNCYTTALDNTYTMSSELDYPSISQLNAAMRDNSIIPIFAVTQSEFSVYQNLTEYIEGAQAAVLAADSRNIVEIVKNNYAAITSKVEVVDTAPEDVLVEYTAICLDGVRRPGTQVCEGLTLGDTVSFDVTVTGNTCPDSRTSSFTIRPVGFSEELQVNIDYLCDCDCEGSGIPNSPDCSDGAGTLECGACDCNAGHYGRNCECSSDGPTLEDSDKLCKAGNSTIICSGRGSCVCGDCVCFPRPNPEEVVKGTFCECDNFSCDRHRGQLCGGEEHGTCVCDEASRKSKCQCKAGWSGPSCACSTTTDTCIAANGETCNGYGECVCGACICNANSSYSGAKCEECRACPGKCQANKDCVECKAFGTGLTREQCDKCPYKVIPITGDLQIPNGSERCLVPDNDGCSFIFTYEQFSNDTFVLYVLAEKSCPEPINPLVVIIPIVIGIILIGLLLLILWRVLIYLWDRKEYKQFEKDRANAKWEMGENPIYKPSTTIHKNPMYGK